MAAEPEAGTVNGEQAVLLLVLENQAELRRLERDGAFKQIAPNRYWLKDLVQGYIKHMRAHARETDTRTLALALGVSAQRISQLAHEGWFKAVESTKRGVYDWIEACAGYIKFLRSEDRQTSKSSSESRIRDAKARDIEIRTQQRLARLIPLDVYEEMVDGIAGLVRSEFAGLAASCTRDLMARRIIEREVNARLRRIAEHAMAAAIRLEAAGGADDAIRANGAGPVGGGKPDLPSNGGGTGAA